MAPALPRCRRATDPLRRCPSTASAGALARPDASQAGSNPLLDRLDPAHGQRLAALPCELVWATTWMDDANDCIAPLLGLPQLPVVPWPETDEGNEPGGWDRLHRKTRTLIEWAAGRPFAWVDDEIGDADRVRVSSHHPGHALLHRVDPGQGLADEDFAALDRWLRAKTCGQWGRGRGYGASS